MSKFNAGLRSILGLAQALSVLAIFVIPFDFVQAKSVKSQKVTRSSSEKRYCSKRELDLKDCALRLGNRKLNLLRERWRMTDDLNVLVQELPISQAEAEWEKIAFERFGNRFLLQLWIWSPPSGEAGVQELNWFVYEIGSTPAPQRVHQVVQRRHQIQSTDRVPASVQRSRYVYDPKDKHEIRLKGQSFEWKVGSKRGEF